MRQHPCQGPIHRLIHVRERWTAFDHARNELVHQVRMRSAVAAALSKRKVSVFVIVNALRSEALDGLRQKARVVWHGDALGLLADVDYGLLILDLGPLERHFVAVDVEAFDILPRGFEQGTGYFEGQLLVAHFEKRALHRERRSVLGDQLILNSTRTEARNVLRLAAHQREAGTYG